MTHPTIRRDRLVPATTFALLALLGCGRLSRPVSVDPDVNFAAHVEHDRIVLDRVPGAHGGVVEAPGWFHLGTPTFVVTSQGETLANLALTAPATVEVRGGGAGASPLGAVEPSWDDNALRVRLRSSADGVLQSDVFARTVTGVGPSLLTRNAQAVVDVRGTYRAALRDAKGAEAGWLRVRVTPYAESPRIYDGVLPPEVGAGLAAATAVALGSELDWIESHALDVYRSGTPGGPLHQSVPR